MEILYPDHKPLRSVTYANLAVDNRLKNVLNTSQRHLEDMLTRTLSLDDTSRKGLEDVLKASLQDLKISWKDVLKTS